MDPVELERLVDASLKELPLPDAPSTLVARVMAAVDVDRRPWYARPWLAWPRGWQAASAALLAVVIAAGVFLVPTARLFVEDAATATVARMPLVEGGVSRAAAAVQHIEAALTAVQVVWRVIFVPFVVYAAVLVALLCATFAAFATAIAHVAFRKGVS